MAQTRGQKLREEHAAKMRKQRRKVDYSDARNVGVMSTDQPKRREAEERSGR